LHRLCGRLSQDTFTGVQHRLQKETLLAWVFTLPTCTILGAVLFTAGLFVVLRIF